MKKLLCLILTLTLALPCLFTCAAADEIMPRASNYFTSYGTSLSATGGGRIAVTFRAVGTGICSQLGVAHYYVQRLDDDGSWDSASVALPGQTGSNVASYTFGRSFQGVAGETYRVVVTFVCTINNSTECKSYTSGSVTAR